jgi:hypothetical protein
MKLLKSVLPVRRMVQRLAVLLAALAVGLAACSVPELSNTGERPAPASQKDEAPPAQRTYATTAQVLDAVKAARDVQKLPAAAAAALADSVPSAPGQASKNHAGPQVGFDCHPKPARPRASGFGECAYGDSNGTKVMVMYGDSHAPMWAGSLEGVAAKHGWKLYVFSLGGCPAMDLHFADPDTHAPNTECDEFHKAAITAIQDLHPDLVVATSIGGQLADGSWPSGDQWRDAWISTFHKLTQPGTRMAMLGGLPYWDNNDARCLAAHVNDVQKCSAAAKDGIRTHPEDEAAATALGALYVPTDPWICSDRCEPAIADQLVYEDHSHLTQTYAVYLTGALEEALQPVLDQA